MESGFILVLMCFMLPLQRNLGNVYKKSLFFWEIEPNECNWTPAELLHWCYLVTWSLYIQFSVVWHACYRPQLIIRVRHFHFLICMQMKWFLRFEEIFFFHLSNEFLFVFKATNYWSMTFLYALVSLGSMLESQWVIPYLIFVIFFTRAYTPLSVKICFRLWKF